MTRAIIHLCDQTASAVLRYCLKPLWLFGKKHEFDRKSDTDQHDQRKCFPVDVEQYDRAEAAEQAWWLSRLLEHDERSSSDFEVRTFFKHSIECFG